MVHWETGGNNSWREEVATPVISRVISKVLRKTRASDLITTRIFIVYRCSREKLNYENASLKRNVYEAPNNKTIKKISNFSRL